MIVFAHAGHWAPDLAIYVGPIVIDGLGYGSRTGARSADGRARAVNT